MSKHIVLPTGLHCIIDDRGVVQVYTEEEYTKTQILNSWWKKIENKYFNREK